MLWGVDQVEEPRGLSTLVADRDCALLAVGHRARFDQCAVAGAVQERQLAHVDEVVAELAYLIDRQRDRNFEP